MKKILGILALAAAGGLAACDGNSLLPAAPVADPADPVVDPVVDPNDGGIGGDPDLPPGTASPTPDDGIFRVEEGGDAQTFFYDSSTDEFTVDNLPFDAVGPQPPGATGDRYVRVTAAPAIGTLDPDGIPGNRRIAVYQNADGLNAYKLVYGTSASGDTSFAIVRSSSYLDYGPGGFIYERNNDVVIPDGGTANYDGEYAGVRIFDNDGGIELTEGLIAIEVDFEDFNVGGAIQGFMTNRVAYDPEDATSFIALNDLILNTGEFSSAGEFGGTANSYDGASNDVVESGQYFGLLSGADAGEMVGMIVITSENEGPAGGSIQETGGFLATTP